LFGGWSSNSKYAVLGSLRAAAQVISYEIPMFLSILPIIAITGSLNLFKISEFQIINNV
jgi:NADH-quinone oxidoreductase subunit H